LAAALAHEFPQDDFILVSDQPFELPCSLPNVRAGSRPDNILERRWWTFGLQRELKKHSAVLFHGLNFDVPFPATVPAVMTIHDLSPWISAPWVDDAWRMRSARVRKRVPWMIRTGTAQHIITPSEAIRKEVINFLGLAPARVTAVPLAAAPHFRPQPNETSRPYFFYAGMLEPRKNVDAVIAAWELLRKHRDVDLVLAGPHREEVHLPLPRPGLRRRGVVSEKELAELYSGAVALVYPSLYEGFGLPLLEAMQCGTPAIISEDPALTETAGNAAIRVNIRENAAEGLAQAMQSLLDNENLRAEMGRRALDRAALFSWERTARATHNVYRGILSA
jgi:alpha-1,3-rhamnosyl/mannosyltransferase